MAKSIKIDILGEFKRVPICLKHMIDAGRANSFVADVFTVVGNAYRLARPRKYLPTERERLRKQKLHAYAEELQAAKLHKLSRDGKRLMELLKASEQIT